MRMQKRRKKTMKKIMKTKIYLQSRDGGGKSFRDAKKHKATLMRAVRSDDSGNINYNKLLDYQFLIDWMSRLEAERKEAGTVKVYLGSVQHFYHYLKLRQCEEITTDNIEKMELYILKWKKNLWKDIKRRQGAKNYMDFKKYPTTEEMNKIDESDVSKEAHECLKLYSVTNESIKRTGFCSIRDYIITSLILDNGSRPGAIANMTLQEYKLGTKQKDGYVVAVMKHKNDYISPAYLSFTHELREFTDKYVKFVREKLPGVSKELNDPVFISWSGAKMAGDLITSQFSKYWNKTQGTTSRINPNIIRKFTTTMVHEMKPEQKRKTASHLCHSEKVADECYDFIDKINTASETSRQIRQTQRSRKTTHAEKEQGKNDNDDEGDDDYVPDEDDIEETKKVSKVRRKEFSEKENFIIRKHLHSYITTKCPIIRKEFDIFLKSIPALKPIYAKFGLNSMIVKVRTERNYSNISN